MSNLESHMIMLSRLRISYATYFTMDNTSSSSANNQTIVMLYVSPPPKVVALLNLRFKFWSTYWLNLNNNTSKGTQRCICSFSKQRGLSYHVFKHLENQSTHVVFSYFVCVVFGVVFKYARKNSWYL